MKLDSAQHTAGNDPQPEAGAVRGPRQRSRLIKWGAVVLVGYGTTPAPIYFGAGYVKQRTWWWLGLIASVLNIFIWIGIGFGWWKVLGLW